MKICPKRLRLWKESESYARGSRPAQSSCDVRISHFRITRLFGPIIFIIPAELHRKGVFLCILNQQPRALSCLWDGYWILYTYCKAVKQGKDSTMDHYLKSSCTFSGITGSWYPAEPREYSIFTMRLQCLSDYSQSLRTKGFL